MTPALLLALKLSVVAVVFGIGLGSTPRDLAYLWRRPGQLARSLVAMYVLVPVVILLLASVLPMAPSVRTAILVLAISAGAPLLPKKLMKLGREGYVFSLVATSSVLAIVVVPLWVHLLAALFGRDASVEPGSVARLLAKAFLVPLVLGMLLRWPLSTVAERISDGVLAFGGIVLAVAGLALLALHGHLLIDTGWRPFGALLGMTLVALAVGHVMGGPDPGDRTALAVCCASRHVGIAMLAASTVPGPKTAALVVAYVLAATIVSVLYLRGRSRGGRVPAPKGEGRDTKVR